MTDTPEISQDVIDQAAALSQKLQEDSLKEMATALVDGLKEAFGGEAGLMEFGKEMNAALKTKLSPEIYEEMNAVDAAVKELHKAGKKMNDDPDLMARFIALHQNPEFTAANDALFNELFAEPLPSPAAGDEPSPSNMG